ncbi:diacylglycerol O-acyltransferase / trehalose O-mycolyltransferase [Corynebacterium pollutisoli]|uniref:Diacylglycerol O-acyltransferase / trehalose O-mycolyltransferase n=2 Tax=Corynebacterium pollutisoli TaxID=1610489 RepID=A0A1X7IY53_9CORY|nr:alpha/beta hydrolase family protein [Corynebacterium pollutisoli]SMG20228.1 diacylglycerol O-acyltransferase / trehalose O-mycolyltransferase [Corynebacterium pollutisoli]
MSVITGARSVSRKIVAVVTAIATALAIMVAGGTGVANADNRGWLRPDATGHCEWDAVAYWVQRCDVWSPSTGANITVQVQPAGRGGNAGFYLLDGLRATNHANAWTVDVNAPELYADSNITLVMPVGGAASFYADWDHPATYDLNNPVTYQWETFLTSELPAYLQQHFGVAPDNNSIAGLSMGGTAALNLAAKHPGQFRQALSWSGYLTQTMPGMQTLMRVALLDAGGFNINAMYGTVVSPRRFENDPFLNMDGLRGKDVYISAATGIPGPEDANYPANLKLSGAPLEMLARVSTHLWEGKARATGINVTADYPMTGIHNWTQFGHQLHETKPRVLDVMNAW